MTIEYVILRCKNCGKEFMCLEGDVPELEEEGCECGNVLNFEIVPNEDWEAEDWIEVLKNILEDHNRTHELETLLPALRVLKKPDQIEFVKKYLN